MRGHSSIIKQIGLFLSLLLIVPLIAFSIVQQNGPEVRKQALVNLDTLAGLKAEQVESWLAERQIDLEFLNAGEGFAEHAERLVLTGDAKSRAVVTRRLEAFSKSRYYRTATLLNASGQVVANAGEPSDPYALVTRQLCQTALKSGQIAHSDLYRDANTGLIHLDYVLPLRATGGRQPVAVVLLHAPADDFLFPLIQTWPTPSPSAETLLVRRDGNDVLFLNELRHRHGSALALRLPLDTPNLPAAVAVRNGKTQAMEGVDYRGVAVFAATRPIPGTPWHVVAKIDRDEVMAPLNELIYWVSLVAFLAIAIIAMIIWRLWLQILHSQRLELAAQTTDSLRESEVKYHRLYDSMMDAYVMVDMSGHLLDFNPAYREMLGYSDKELRGLTYADLTLEKWRQVEAQIVEEQIIPHGQSPVYEKECTRKDGTVFPVELRVFLLRDKNNRPEAMWAIVRDITERKQAEEILREREQHFRTLANGGSTLIWTSDLDKLCDYFNEPWLRFTGRTLERELGNGWAEGVHPDDREHCLEIYVAAFDQREPFSMDYRLRCADGSYRWIRDDGNPRYDSQGKFLGYIGFCVDIDQQKKISVELEESIRQLRETESAMGLAGIGVHQIDASTGRLLYVNDFFCQVHGYTRGELLAMSIMDLNPALPALPFHEIVEPVCQKGSDRFETVHRHRNGHTFPVEITLYYHPPQSDRPGYFVSFMSDISQRKEIEDKMRLDGEQQTTLRHLLETSLGGGPVEETLEHCLERLLATSWLSILPKGGILLSDEGGRQLRMVVAKGLAPEIHSLCAEVPYGHCLCGRAAASGKIQFASHVDERHEIGYCGMQDHGHYCLPLTANGQTVGVLVLYLPPGVFPEPEKERFLASVADILAGYVSRKTGEQALTEHQARLETAVRERTADLKASEARTRAILAIMLDSVVHIDAHGIILSVNDAVQDMFGYMAEEMVGRNVSILMPEPHASAHDGYISRYLQTRQLHVIGVRREVMGCRKDGSLFPIELAVNEMADDEGSTFIGVMRDMTAQMAAERELKRALQAAQDAAEAKSNFLANMSHEIRTPLNGVLGLAQIGMRDNRENGAAETFRRILDSGSHLLAVVNDILDFSKIEAGKLKIEKRPFALFAAIDNVKSFVAARALEKGLTLSVSLAPDLSVWVEGDSLRLTQILTNLLSNAIKFTVRGEVMLRVARDGDDLEFMVVDSGIGMSEEQLARLFQPFEQADSTTTRNYGGSGLGLAISRELARLMGGDITTDSRPGAGSSFYLHLPLPATVSPVHPGESGDASAATGPRLTGISVLAADDVDINRFILEDLLTHEGVHIVFAEDGQQALDILEERGVSAFDVVLMDVQMPVMDGFEATRRIAAIAPGLPVIGLTAHAMVEERDKCFAAGMVDHVVKPVNIDTLVAAIRRQVPLATAPAPAPAAILPSTMAPDGSLFAGCDDPEIIDLAILVSRVGSEPAKIAKYAARFVETARDTLSEMKAALAAGDLSALSGLGHRLKSAALTVGAMRFGELCHELERFKASDDLEAAHARLEQLHELFEQIARRVKDVA